MLVYILIGVIAFLLIVIGFLVYLYKLGDHSIRNRVIQTKINDIEGDLGNAVEEIPDDFYRSLNPKYVPDLKQQLDLIEIEERGRPNYSIEPN